MLMLDKEASEIKFSPPHDAKRKLGHYYKVFEGRYTWHESKRKCESMGGHLVCMETKSENQFVTKLANNRELWLGGTDEAEEGRWMWVTGAKIVYSSWYRTEPSNHGGKEHYLHIRRNGLWNDAPSNAKKGFICEWDSR